MFDLPSSPNVGNIGQLAPDTGNGPGFQGPSIWDKLRQYAMAAAMARSQNQPGMQQQQQQMPQQQPQIQQNPGIGGLQSQIMGPQQTGLTPQFGQQIGQGIRSLFGG